MQSGTSVSKMTTLVLYLLTMSACWIYHLDNCVYVCVCVCVSVCIFSFKITNTGYSGGLDDVIFLWYTPPSPTNVFEYWYP